MKHLHLFMVMLTITLFIFSACRIIMNEPKSRVLAIISHIIYTVTVGSGLVLLYRLWQVAGVQYWAIAKIMLLIVAIVAMMKASKQSGTKQAKAGVGVAMLALVCIVVFAFTKPMLG